MIGVRKEKNFNEFTYDDRLIDRVLQKNEKGKLVLKFINYSITITEKEIKNRITEACKQIRKDWKEYVEDESKSNSMLRKLGESAYIKYLISNGYSKNGHYFLEAYSKSRKDHSEIYALDPYNNFKCTYEMPEYIDEYKQVKNYDYFVQIFNKISFDTKIFPGDEIIVI